MLPSNHHSHPLSDTILITPSLNSSKLSLVNQNKSNNPNSNPNAITKLLTNNRVKLSDVLNRLNDAENLLQKRNDMIQQFSPKHVSLLSSTETKNNQLNNLQNIRGDDAMDESVTTASEATEIMLDTSLEDSADASI